MSSDTPDFHPGYLHPDTLEIMQDDNRLASQLGRHHDHHAASQRHREALSEHSPAVTPVLTPRAVLSSAMLVSAVDGGNVLTVGKQFGFQHALPHIGVGGLSVTTAEGKHRRRVHLERVGGSLFISMSKL